VARPQQVTAAQARQPSADHGNPVPVLRGRPSHRCKGARRCGAERQARTRNRRTGEKAPAREGSASDRPLLELVEDGLDREPASRCRLVNGEHAPQ
jgi:hypothetical protein